MNHNQKKEKYKVSITSGDKLFMLTMVSIVCHYTKMTVEILKWGVLENRASLYAVCYIHGI